MLTSIQEYLNDKDAGVRGMVISALRYTLADSEEIYNDNLGLIIVQMLNTMLNESDIENRRLALTTLSSAAHNKPKLMMRHLDELLPLALKETNVHPELIRDVQMGPFRHKVDDGLELRKVRDMQLWPVSYAYQSFSLLMKPFTPYSRIFFHFSPCSSFTTVS